MAMGRVGGEDCIKPVVMWLKIESECESGVYESRSVSIVFSIKNYWRRNMPDNQCTKNFWWKKNWNKGKSFFLQEENRWWGSLFPWSPGTGSGASPVRVSLHLYTWCAVKDCFTPVNGRQQNNADSFHNLEGEDPTTTKALVWPIHWYTWSLYWARVFDYSRLILESLYYSLISRIHFKFCKFWSVYARSDRWLHTDARHQTLNQAV